MNSKIIFLDFTFFPKFKILVIKKRISVGEISLLSNGITNARISNAK